MLRLILFLFLLVSVVGADELPDHDITIFQLQGERLLAPIRAAKRSGYDNQPHFSNDSKSIYYTRVENDIADIWTWSKSDGEERLVGTQLSEFSPTVMPGGGGLSTVRVEEDGTQRLWRLSESGEFDLIFNSVKPVGYHAWSGDNVGLFVLGEPHRLEVTKLGQETTKFVVENIGRCLQPVPGRDAVSFTVTFKGLHFLGVYDFEREKLEFGRGLPRGTQDYVWLDQKNILTSNGTILMSSPWEGGKPWTHYSTPGPLQGVTRLAISPDRSRLAVVHRKRGWFR